MNPFGNLVTKIERQNEKMIGQVECSSASLPSMLIGMMQSMGMANPSGLYYSSNKGIRITKKGGVYTLILSMYNPPIELSWTGNIPLENLLIEVEKLIQERKVLSFINIVKLKGGKQSLQMALSA